MEEAEGVDKLYFELASESRLGILAALLEGNLKMQEVARRLDLTATEASRQLERLSAASLIQRQPDGSYGITPYGRLELHLSSSLEFVFKHKSYFMTHDLWLLPPQFISRIGELSQADLKMGLVESTMRTSQLIGAAEKRMWAISPEPLTMSFAEVSAQVPKGAEFRVISPHPPARLSNLENRMMAECPVALVVTEKEASVHFRLSDGRTDHASFVGADQRTMDWSRDLFLHYWDLAKRS